METWLQGRGVGGVIVTSALLLEDEKGQKVVDLCRQNGAWVRLMRLELKPVV